MKLEISPYSDSSTQEGHLPLAEKQQKVFAEHGLYRTVLISQIRVEAAAVRKNDKFPDIEQSIKHICDGLPTEYKAIGKNVAASLLQQELACKEWTKEHGLAAVATELGVADTRVEQMLGGFAVVVSPETFREKGIVTQIFVDGERTDDASEIQSGIEKLPQIGFTTDIQNLNPDSSLPKGTKIMLIADSKHARTQADFVKRTMVHEERESIGMAIDAARGTENAFATAMHDLGARLADAEENVNLASLGFTPEDVSQKKEEMKALKAITGGIQQQIAAGRNPKEIASEMQGAAIAGEDMWQTAAYVNGDKPQEALQDETDITADDFNGIVLRGDVEGRFVNNAATLPLFSTLEHNFIPYTVKKIIGRGGFGIVYEAFDNKSKPVAIKEIVLDAPQALFASQLTARAFIESIIESQPNPFQANPALIIKSLRDRLAPSPQQEHTEQHKFAEIYFKYLDDAIRKSLYGLVNEKKVFYQGNFAFTWKKTDEGSPIIDENLRAKAIIAIQQAIEDYPTLSDYLLIPIAQRIVKRDNPSLTDSQATPKITQLVYDLNPVNKRNELNESVALFIAESETLTRLQGIDGVAGSRGIVRSGVYDEKNPSYDNYYMIQELAKGRKLTDVLQNANWSLKQKIDFVANFLKILKKVHERGVIHKDIKPENIYVTSDGQPTIVDFGIAKAQFEEVNTAWRDKSRRGTTRRGTMVYNSPEHIIGHTDPRSDIYSTGILLYEMVTGDDAHASMQKFGEDGYEERIQYMKQKLGRKDIYGNNIYPDKIQEVILRATQETPASRYQSAQQMLSVLESVEIVTKNDILDTLLDKVNQTPIGRTATSDKQGSQKKFSHTVDGKYISIINKYGLPDTFVTYLDTIQQMAKHNPDLLDDALKRLDDLIDDTRLDRDIRYELSNICREIALDLLKNALHQGKRFNTRDIAQIDSLIFTVAQIKDILHQIAQKQPDLAVQASNTLAKRIDYRVIDDSMPDYLQFITVDVEKDRQCLQAMLERGVKLLQENNSISGGNMLTLGDKTSWMAYGKNYNVKYKLPPSFEAFFDKLKAIAVRSSNQKDVVISQLDAIAQIKWDEKIKDALIKHINKMKADISPQTTTQRIIV